MKSMKFKFKPKDGSCISKFADTGKSPKERLQAFLQAKDGCSAKDTLGDDEYDGTSFLRDNCGEIIFLIYEAFWHYVDHAQSKKRKKSSLEEADLLEIILPTLERVLQFLPDKICDLWHYHGIAGILKTILSANHLAPNNATDLKFRGIKLTVLWILGLLNLENKESSVVVDVFNHILPELKHPEQESPDKETIDSRFQFLLDNLTCNIRQVHWPDVSEQELRKRRIDGFRTLFELFKKSYLIEILRGRNPACRDKDGPLIIEKEVENHFNKPMNELPDEQLDFIFLLNDRIMKWFVRQGKSILPHDKTNCMFVSKGDELYMEVEDYEEEVEVCRIVDRVLFTDQDNIKLMNHAFEHGPLVLQRRPESNFAELMSLEENNEFSFIKMITLYSELIYNIKDCNVLGNKYENQPGPEFLSDSRLSNKKWNSQRVERRIKNFLKSATLNVSPLLRYPYSFLAFSSSTRKMIESAAQTTMGYYNVIVQQIEQADSNTCYRIILCMIQSIEHNFNLGFPIQTYEKQLHNVLHVVRFVGRKVVLPANTWTHLRNLLFKLEKKEETAPTANVFWLEVMKALTQEIFVLVYGVEWKPSRGKDEKAQKIPKGKLPYNIEEKSHLNTRFNAALSRLHLFRSEKQIVHKTKAQGNERSQTSLVVESEYHYHGLNKIFIESVSLKNRNNEHWDDHNNNDDELRPNNGEHPIILWRRFLTLKGNPNKYSTNAALHKRMFESFSEILDMLLWLEDNKDKQNRKYANRNYRDNVPDHPVFTYINHILPWFLEAFLMNPSEDYLPGKKVAFGMLCKCLVRQNPIKPSIPQLHLFYNVLSNCLRRETSQICSGKRLFQKPRAGLLFEVVKGTKNIFSMNLNGCHLEELVGILSEGAIRVLDPCQVASAPKVDAILLLGSLCTYPWTEESLKQRLLNSIKEVAKSELDQFNRIRAIQMLGYIIMTMLSKRSVNNPVIYDQESSFIPQTLSSDSKILGELIYIVMLQVRSSNSRVALSSLSVIRDIADEFDTLLAIDPALPKQIMEVLLSSLNQYMDIQKPDIDESYDCDSPTNSSPTLYDPLSTHSKNWIPVPQSPPGSDSVIKSYQEAVITTNIMTLLDWVLNMPQHIPATFTLDDRFVEYEQLLKTVFKVLQLVALEKPFNELVKGYCSILTEKKREYKISDIKEGDFDVETIEMSYPTLPGSEEPHIHKNIKSCAIAALLLLCQWHHQFPLCGGPDYSSSMVYEYDRDDRNKDAMYFDREQHLQILMMDSSNIISMVEFGHLPDEIEPSPDLMLFETQNGYSRVIFRNIVGRFSWLSKKLWALKEPPESPLPPSDLTDSTTFQIEVDDCPTLTPSQTLCRTESGTSCLPFCLSQTIEYIKETSPELSFYRDLKKSHGKEDLYNKVASMLRNQTINEGNTDSSPISGTPDNLTLGSDLSAGWSHSLETTSPFQHCRNLAGALGLLSWNKRYNRHGRQVELLDHSKIVDKEKDIRGDLNELDNAFNREIHKFGLIYIAAGDEKRKDVLSHDIGSKEFEQFVAGLGWEVNWKDLHGYVPTIGTDVMKSTTAHYANATTEIVFHIGTRLEPGNQDAALYRFKYIGNDYIGVIWSEHERDVNIDTFKSAYLNYVIVIYPMKDMKKCRIQVIVNFRDKEEKCKSIEHGIGPLFDGALVDRDILPVLVRRTIINAERAINLYQNRPMFYRDRARNLEKLQNYKRDVTFEELACELMSPSLVDFGQFRNYKKTAMGGVKLPPQNSGSARFSKKTSARQSTGPSSQDLSESERSEKKKSKRTRRRENSNSDNFDTCSSSKR